MERAKHIKHVLCVTLLVVYCLLSVDSAVGSMGRAAPQSSTAQRTLNLSQIEELISNQTPDAAIARAITQRGLNFTPKQSVIERLRKKGAGPKTLLALQSKVPKPPESKAERSKLPTDSENIPTAVIIKCPAPNCGNPVVIHPNEQIEIVAQVTGRNNATINGLIPDWGKFDNEYMTSAIQGGKMIITGRPPDENNPTLEKLHKVEATYEFNSGTASRTLKGELHILWKRNK